jgi:hypothetical protein
MSFVKHNSKDEVKENEMGRTCSTNVEKANAYMLSVRMAEGNRLLGRVRHK